MITANKGEWSELYALFKLLCDGELSAGDENLNKIDLLRKSLLQVHPVYQCSD
ncbi:HpaII family restriction endonuclease [Acinetobacter sp. NS4_7]